MEALDREFNRQQRRLDPEKVLKPVSVNTMTDIKSVLSELDPAKNKQQSTISLSTELQSVDNQGNSTTYNVSADTKSKTKRDMLIEGLDLIRKRMEMEEETHDTVDPVEINGRIMKPASLGTGVHSHSWVDPLIRQWLGGRREGIKICWDLADGYRYEYDIYGHKLSRISNNEADQS
jgi:hypothetical protein